MAQAVVTNLKSCFRDIASARAQQFRGSFHPDLPQELLHRHSTTLRELAAQIEGAAIDHASQFLQRRRSLHPLLQDQLGLVNPFSRQALSPGAEQFASSRSKK